LELLIKNGARHAEPGIFKKSLFKWEKGLKPKRKVYIEIIEAKTKSIKFASDSLAGKSASEFNLLSDNY
jgi:tRNA U34 5-carboxymethylaminomethyl modifying GTPase MnmE/TrmE